MNVHDMSVMSHLGSVLLLSFNVDVMVTSFKNKLLFYFNLIKYLNTAEHKSPLLALSKNLPFHSTWIKKILCHLDQTNLPLTVSALMNIEIQPK